MKKPLSTKMYNIDEIRQRFEKEENLKIQSKIKSLDSLSLQLGIDINSILNLYNDSKFRDTDIPKKDLFFRILTVMLTKEDRIFLTNCGNKVNSHQKDKRSALEYAVDIVVGWFEEDIIRSYLLSQGVKVDLNGADSRREFLVQKELSTIPDFIIGEKLVEVVFDRSNHWITYGEADLRDNKYERLTKENALLLGISPKSGMGFCMEISDPSCGFVPSFIGGYHKPGYTTPKVKNFMRPIKEVLNDFCLKFKEKETIIL